MIKLKDKFIGTGEVRGFEFSKIKENEYAFVYKVSYTNEDGVSKYWYEVFEKRVSKEAVIEKEGVQINLEEKETYPKSNSFGKWAWTCVTLDKALDICTSISNKLEEKAKNKQLLT